MRMISSSDGAIGSGSNRKATPKPVGWALGVKLPPLPAHRGGLNPPLISLFSMNFLEMKSRKMLKCKIIRWCLWAFCPGGTGAAGLNAVWQAAEVEERM